MRRDALSGMIFVDDNLVWNGLKMTFSGQPFRQLLEHLRQSPKIILPASLPRFVIVAIAVVLHPPFQIGAPGGRVDFLDEPVGLTLRDVVFQVS